MESKKICSQLVLCSESTSNAWKWRLDVYKCNDKTEQPLCDTVQTIAWLCECEMRAVCVCVFVWYTYAHTPTNTVGNTWYIFWNRNWFFFSCAPTKPIVSTYTHAMGVCVYWIVYYTFYLFIWSNLPTENKSELIVLFAWISQQSVFLSSFHLKIFLFKRRNPNVAFMRLRCCHMRSHATTQLVRDFWQRIHSRRTTRHAQLNVMCNKTINLYK